MSTEKVDLHEIKIEVDGQTLLNYESIEKEPTGQSIATSSRSSIVESKTGHHPTNENDFDWVCTSSDSPNLKETPMFKCLSCSYQTSQKRLISRHILRHTPKTIQCPYCPYKTNAKRLLKQHELVHVPPEETDLYKCPECPFTSRRKRSVTQHFVMHKNPDEITWYQCPECPYKTKRKRSLETEHMIIHRKDLPMYKCALCSYDSPRERYIQTHMNLVHKPKEISLCPSEAIVNSKLKQDESSNKIYYRFNCSQCPYQTNKKSTFETHQLVHKKTDEIADWFYCYVCSWKTPRKGNLGKHIGKHRDAEGRLCSAL